MRRWVFGFGVVTLSRALMLRDRLLGKIGTALPAGASRHAIASDAALLDAVLMQPQGNSRAVLLICHGIGETVEHWSRAQTLLAAHGVASLVFNYAGMARSTGRFSARQAERDALSAHAWMRDILPNLPITLLGFSLGTGVASAVANRIDAESLVLCDGYTSFREATAELGAPAFVCGALPDEWRNVDALRSCRAAVLVVHGEQDRLFPVAMAKELAAACGGSLEIIPGMGHSDLHDDPRGTHWGLIVDWILR